MRQSLDFCSASSTSSRQRPGELGGPKHAQKKDRRDAILSRHPLLEYCQRLGMTLKRDGGGNRWKALCPFHQEQSASFVVYADENRYHCFGCGAHGTIIDFVAHRRGITIAQAMRELAGEESTPKNNSAVAKPYDPSRDRRKATLREKWPVFEKPSKTEISAIAEARGLSTEGVSLAADAGLLFCCELHEARAWVVTDSARLNAQARRLDGETWTIDREPTKAWTLPGSIAAWPIGLRASRDFPAIALVEGGPDLLAAFHLAWCSGQETQIAPVAMLGAALSIPPLALPLFAGKHTRIFAHRDSAGFKAERRWWRQLTQAGVRVDGYDFAGLVTAEGESVEDLNDFAHVHPDQWESSRESIEDAFVIRVP